MNKLLIVLLAVCLITECKVLVNAAFVKRAAETPNFFDDASKKAQELLGDLQRQVSGALNPDQIKKAFSDSVDNINKLFDANKQGEAKQ